MIERTTNVILLFLGVSFALGCRPDSSPKKYYIPPAVAIPSVTSVEMHELVQSSPQPVVVEFGVDFACARCDDMRGQIADLAQELEGTARVVRVDFNANRELAAQYGANICPSYVIFDQGRVVNMRSYPTSADMIRTDLVSPPLRSESF